MATALWAIGLVLFATIIGAFGPIFLKKGTDKLNRNVFSSLKGFLKATIGNGNLVFGISFYSASFVIYILALRGGDLSVIYPLVSLSYVWVSILSIWILKEHMNSIKWSGVLFIILGAALVGLGS